MTYGIGARMRAARHMAGIRSVEALAEKLRERGVLGLEVTTLRTIEREERRPEFKELREIAEACDLDVAFFTADFARLPEISEDPRRVIAEETTAALERARRRRKDNDEGSEPHREAGQ